MRAACRGPQTDKNDVPSCWVPQTHLCRQVCQKPPRKVGTLVACIRRCGKQGSTTACAPLVTAAWAHNTRLPAVPASTLPSVLRHAPPLASFPGHCPVRPVTDTHPLLTATAGDGHYSWQFCRPLLPVLGLPQHRHRPPLAWPNTVLLVVHCRSVAPPQRPVTVRWCSTFGNDCSIAQLIWVHTDPGMWHLSGACVGRAVAHTRTYPQKIGLR